MHDPGVQPPHQQPADLDLEILDLLRKDAQSAGLLARALSQEGEQVGVDDVRSHLNGLASRGLVRFSRSPHATEARGDEPTAKKSTGGRSPRRAAQSSSRIRGWPEPLTIVPSVARVVWMLGSGCS
jgi:repressor of nif and glnA expression